MWFIVFGPFTDPWWQVETINGLIYGALGAQIVLR
jgi:hypothetical protein